MSSLVSCGLRGIYASRMGGSIFVAHRFKIIIATSHMVFHAVPVVDRIGRFSRWAAGDLTGNRTRGLYAEWMLADRLGLIDADSVRTEWDMVDLRFGSLLIEVKTSGIRQQWSERETVPRFSIDRQHSMWDALSNTTVSSATGARAANLYVFCLHSARELTNRSVMDERHWSFWVMPTASLDTLFPNQRSIGTRSLRRISNEVSLDAAVRHIQQIAAESA